MKISSSRIIYLILGGLGILVTGVLIFNGLHSRIGIGDMLRFGGALIISLGFITQGAFESVPWYSLILLQLGAALYVSPLCLILHENPASIVGWLFAIIVGLIFFDGIKRIVMHFNTDQEG